MRLITAEQVIDMRPCSKYTEEIIRTNHGPNGITPRQIAMLDIPIHDRCWVLWGLVPGRNCITKSTWRQELDSLVDYLEQQ